MACPAHATNCPDPRTRRTPCSSGVRIDHSSFVSAIRSSSYWIDLRVHRGPEILQQCWSRTRRSIHE
jgi:hypothetical protein